MCRGCRGVGDHVFLGGRGGKMTEEGKKKRKEKKGELTIGYGRGFLGLRSGLL